MEIWATFDGTAWNFSPDPAVVTVGALITWKFQANNQAAPRIRWTVYFDHGSPFKSQGKQFVTTTTAIVGQHTGSTAAVTADTPGDYKYGVRAEDTSTQNILGDDDPHLLVTP